MIATATSSQGWKLVEDEYSKLQACIGDLGKTINDTLADRHEEQELSHSTELGKLATKINQLKLDKMRLEESIASNERANLLEKERDWFKKEALHLDKMCEDMNKEKKELKDKLDDVEDDRKWMKEQLEKLTKRNWVLEKKLKDLGIGGTDECAKHEKASSG